MPKTKVIYKDGSIEEIKYDYLYEAEDKMHLVLSCWNNVEKVEVYDRHGDLIYEGHTRE